LHCFAI